MQLGVNIRRLTADISDISDIPDIPDNHPTANNTMAFVALIVDAAARFANVHVPAQTWKEVIDILEDAGCEVVEDQTEEYDPEDLASAKALNKAGVMTIDQLLHHSTFIPNP